MSKVETQYIATPGTLTDGEFAVALCDSGGRMATAEQFAPVAEDNTNGVLACALAPLATDTYTASFYADLGTASIQNIKAGAGNLFSFWCRNTAGATRYLQFHDTATTPAGGATPRLTFQMGATSVLTLGRDFFGAMGLYFSSGIAVAFSSAEVTYSSAGVNMTDIILHATYK